ncbi:UvrD-helicase domain-containing protein [Pseudarthrobacter sp. O4]|uniref:UvrD-helicase domain-containing protein n=1 Tax=Pseudarthrobacter sp. O4 TaxID=3418417 RepID=UPI003CE72BA4
MNLDDEYPEELAGARTVAPGLWRPTDIEDLEPTAWEALRHTGNAAVTAGPGAGKTEFLAQRAAYLLQTGVCRAPGRILAISYKRDSAINLARRVAARVPDHAHRFVSLTFDAFTKGLVDRFAQALPSPWRFDHAGYDIQFWYERAVRDFLTEIARNGPAGMERKLYSINAGRFLADTVGIWKLPLNPEEVPASAEEYAAWSWWQEQYLGSRVPTVDFTMLNRIADLLVRSNPRIARALRATYPFVFVDEFQDTTSAQITFLQTVFGHPGVDTTAVGDSKQRIMRFAGALEDAMGRYEKDFSAKRFHLTWNFRSSAELVSAQHHVASKLDPAITQGVSKAKSETGHVPLEIWTYPNEARQSEHIAEWIATDISSSGRSTSDFALVARQKVADIEPTLAIALSRRGISLRNDDTTYGKLRLTELLKNDVIQLLIGVLQLAAEKFGLASTWVETQALLNRINGNEHSVREERTSADHLSAFTSDLRQWLRTNPVSTTDPVSVIQRATLIVEAKQLKAFVRSQHAGDDLALLLEALTERLRAVMKAERSWSQIFSDVAAQDAATLMTIHRSKGLEYHTVIMLGLDDQQWWSYKKDSQEATSTFFVGLSRAAHRVIFTATTPGHRTGGIRALYELLDSAGVKETHWN